MRSLSIVIPALNEAENIPRVMWTIPRAALKEAGWDAEVIVVDNGSTDGTGEVAAAHGARVIRAARSRLRQRVQGRVRCRTR